MTFLKTKTYMQTMPGHYGLILMMIFFACGAQSQTDKLVFSVAGTDKTVSAPLAVLQAVYRSFDIQVEDPFYKKTKSYRAFRLKDVLSHGFGRTLAEADQNHVSLTFLSKDGYNPVMELNRLEKGDAWVAFEDRDVQGGWEPLGPHKADSAPFYIVWNKVKDAPTDYPWPRQLIGITLTVFKDQYPAVIPVGVASGEAVDRGYRLFRNRCLVCHAMNRQGGNKGPDLLAPKAIVTYRSRSFLETYIPKPSAYRFTQMPDSPDLDKKAVDDLIAYLVYIAREDGQAVPDYP